MATGICPWLGIEPDRQLRHTQPSPAHVCYARKPPAEIKLDYQTVFCFTEEHRTCRLYREPAERPLQAASPGPEARASDARPSPRRLPVRWLLIGLATVVVAAAVVLSYRFSARPPAPDVAAAPIGQTGQAPELPPTNPPSAALSSATPAASLQDPTSVVLVTQTPTPATQATATPPATATLTPTAAPVAIWEPTATGQAAAAAPSTGTFTPAPTHLPAATLTTALVFTPSPTVSPAPLTLQGKILFRSTGAGGAGLWAMDAGGRGSEPLAALSAYDAAGTREALSPDGRSLVYAGSFQGQSSVLVRPVQGGGGRPLVIFEQDQASAPVWSPSGDWVAFIVSSPGDAQLWLVTIDGTGVRQLTQSEWGVASHPSFSPDGTRVVYASTEPDGRRQIWVIAVDGTGRTNLSNNEYDDWDPVWAK